MANTNVKRVKTSDLELKDRLVAIQRVTKVTKGGRHFRFAAIVVVGDENGVVGYGLGKANEVTAAIAKGVEDAKKNLVRVPVINTTIPHEQESKFGGSVVFMKPAAPGTGVKAGGAMRAVFESVGIQNVLAKSKGSSNPHNLVKATVLALTQMRDAYTVAGLRGIPMSKVFNGEEGTDMAKLKITQVRSKNGSTQRQIANLRSLGIRKIHQTVEVEKTPVTEGQLAKIRHLVEVEEC